MTKFILTKKLNMTQVFTPEGKVVPVTVLEAAPTKVSQIKTQDKDGYEAVQVSSGKRKREFRTQNGEHKVGQELKVSDFIPGEKVNVTGVSKGRGFAGVMKRHGFHGFPASHGHPHQRAAGSIGQAFPQHVRKGMKMAGRMGGQQATVKSTSVIAVEPEKGLLFVKGSVPGSSGGFVKVVTTGKKKDFSGVFEYGQAEKEEASKAVATASGEELKDEGKDAAKEQVTQEADSTEKAETAADGGAQKKAEKKKPEKSEKKEKATAEVKAEAKKNDEESKGSDKK